MAELLPYIFNAIVIAGLMYLAWRDGFEQGRVKTTRKNLRLKARVIKLNETVVGLDNRIDELEANFNTAKKLLKVAANNVYGCKNIDTLYANDKPYDIASWYPDTNTPDAKPKDPTFDGYKLRCEPELDDSCDTCIRKNTSWCYYCDREHRFYCASEKPEDWNCDTCVNDGDMSHLQCRYCNEGSCYVKKEEVKEDADASTDVN